ncbi:uncharacterized protein [Neodiprion pinetum]|uniref:uncharacterized protein n=1 Tax=Neodiprion pinetum TaxID=441929 RepID=UPI001EE05967|nr:uncharacterized protein LOC124218298 [Neodiprion pinetum]
MIISCRVCPALIAFCFALLVVDILAELIAVRTPWKNDDSIQVICMSEDDESILFWNCFNSSSLSLDCFWQINDGAAFLPRRKNCKEGSDDIVPGETRCLYVWNTASQWKLTNSIDDPMDLTFGNSWTGNPNLPIKLPVQESNGLVFSWRGNGNITLEFEKTNLNCSKEGNVEDIGHTKPNKSDEVICQNSPNYTIEIRPGPYPLTWQSCILKWDKKHEAIEYYLMTTNGSTQEKFNSTVNFDTIEIPRYDGDFLLHNYTYFLTTENHASITRKFYNSYDNLCLYFLVSLCSNCSFGIKFSDKNNNSKYEEIGPFKDSKALSWRWEILNVSSGLLSKSSIHVEMTTRMNGTGQGRWATRYFITCQSRATVRKSSKLLNRGRHGDVDLACEKLSYSEHIYINLQEESIKNITLGSLAQCLRGDGPFCTFNRTNSCNGTSICNPSGCTCPPGCKGANCTEECTEGHYGYNCQNICDQCDPRNCSKINGLCFSGCKQHYVGRYCETQLQRPYIENSTNPTAVILNFSTILDDVDDRNISVEMKNENEGWTPIHMDPNFSGKIKLCIKDLKPEMRYEVQVALDKSKSPALSFTIPYNSRKVKGTPPCDMNFTKNLPIGREENSIKLTFPSIENDEKNYLVLLRNYSTEVSSKLPTLEDVTETSSECGRDACMYDFQQNKNSNSITIGLNHACPVHPDGIYLVRVFFRDSFSDTVYACGNRKVKEFGSASVSSIIKLAIVGIIIVVIIIAVMLYVFYKKFHCILLTNETSVTMAQFVSETFSITNKSDVSIFSDTAYSERLKKFENDVRRAAEDGKLQQQYNLLPKGLRHSCEYGRLPQNKEKNRYRKLIAYDKTRVMLSRDCGDSNSDYINANYVPGYTKQKAYIATQGPTTETVNDFWRMIWQEEVRVICMLVGVMENGKKMCEQYWPEVGGEMEYDEIVVSNLTQDVFADYTYRTFNVTKHCETEMRKIDHLQYTTWPEHGVPIYSHSVIEYLNKVLSIPPGQGPIVVHCSSGTGRTGTIILCDISLRHLAAEGTVDVFAQAKIMYDARADMLESFSQYVMAHLVPTQCLILLPSAVLCRDITPEKINEMKKDLPVFMKRLEECAWMDKAMRPLEPLRPPLPENIKKNRFPRFTPVGPSLVTLQKCPSNDNTSDYISAVSIDGVRTKKQYIASQLPLPTTRSDLWRLIVENNIELIVILQHPNLEDESCCNVIPEKTSVIIPLPYVKVENKSNLETDGCFTVNQLLLTDNSEEPATKKKITVLTCNDWSTEAGASPPPPKALVDLWEASESIVRPEGPTLVLCYDGLTGCGLYLALSFMLERMKVEQDCDVILAVHAVRRSRQEFVVAQWQFEYLYDAALEFNASFKIYDNLS